MTKLGIMADTHLGTLQYHSWQRHKHFGEKWLWAVKTFIHSGVNFVIHGGDLFGKRRPDYIALSQATEGLRFLKNMGIPFFIVEGNHERPFSNEGVGVLDYLESEGLLRKLTNEYATQCEGYNLIGVPYSGLAINEEIDFVLKGFFALEDRDKNILVAHTGLNFYPKDMYPDPNGLSFDVFEEVEKKFHLFITGHIHRSYQFRNNLNPGSTEVCSIKELEYRDNGVMIVELPYGTRPLRICPSEAYKRFALFEIDTDKVDQIEVNATIGASVFKDRVIVVRLRGSGNLDKRKLASLAEANGNILHFISEQEDNEKSTATLERESPDFREMEFELLQKVAGVQKARLYQQLMENALSDSPPEDIVKMVKNYDKGD